MGQLIWSALVRVLILPVLLAGAAVVAVGGTSVEKPDPAAEAFQERGALIGSSYALDDSRIVASSQAEWGFDTPKVTVVAKAKPKPAVQRAVANNPLPPSVAGNAILEEAAKYVGTPYLYGGSTPSGFDCTGFVSYVYAKFGISLPRSSSSYWGIGTRVSAKDARPGDLIVSSGHVGIYAGGNLQIDAPREGKTIQFRGIWQTSYIFVRVS